jgi:hypothetical protein
LKINTLGNQTLFDNSTQVKRGNNRLCPKLA